MYSKSIQRYSIIKYSLKLKSIVCLFNQSISSVRKSESKTFLTFGPIEPDKQPVIMSKELEEQFAGIETPSAAAMFGIKSPRVLLEEARKMHSVQLQTLKLFSQNISDVIFRNRRPEVIRSKKRIGEKLAIIKQLKSIWYKQVCLAAK